MSRPLDDVARSFRVMADTCGGHSPLHTTLSRHVAEEPDLLALASGGAPRKPPPNLRFDSHRYEYGDGRVAGPVSPATAGLTRRTRARPR